MTTLVDHLVGSLAAGGFPFALLSVAVKGFAILAAAALASALLRHASPSLRHLCWSLALAAILVLPLFSLALPSWTFPVLPESLPGHSLVAEANVPALSSGEGLSSEEMTPVPSESEVLAAPMSEGLAGRSWQHWMLWTWLAGAALVLIHMFAGTLGVWHIVARARPVTDPEWLDLVEEMGDRLTITRPIQILRSPAIHIPMVWGVVRPVVLLPADADTWDDERRRCVLAHELAHVKRFDTLTHGLARAACALHWFNPLAWRGMRSMHLEREKACDDHVIRVVRTKASAYATHLLEIARQAPATFSSPIGAVAMARRSQLEGRVLSILDERDNRPMPRESAAATVLLALLLIVPMAMLQPARHVAATSPDPIEWPRVETPQPAPAPFVATRPSTATPPVVDDDTIRRTFRVSPGGTLEIQASQGNIQVRTGAANAVEVEVRRRPRGSASARDFEVSFEQRGSDVMVRGARRGANFRGSNGVNVEFVVTVPPTYNVNLDTKGGNIQVADLNGRANVSTAGGNLSFGRIRGTVDARTSGGNVSVDASSGNVMVRTSGGNIRLGEVGGTVDARTSGGNISIDGVNGELQAVTSGGHINARIRTQPQGPCRLETSGGGITLHLADGIRADLAAKTSAGRVTSDFDVLTRGEMRRGRLQGTINGGGPSLTLDTAAGDIEIRRL